MDFVVTEAIIEPSVVVVHECIIKTVAQNNTQKLPKLIPYWLVKSLDTNMFNKNICFHCYIFASICSSLCLLVLSVILQGEFSP